jgi:hypothetical protein
MERRESTEIARVAEREAQLLFGFANGGRLQVSVRRLVTTAWQRHLTRPRITGALGALHQQHGWTLLTVMDQRGNRGATHAVGRRRLARSGQESRGEDIDGESHAGTLTRLGSSVVLSPPNGGTR